MAQSLYRQASLIMNPYGAKDTLLPSIKPTDGSGDFTFSRDGAGASPATRVNASGLIEKGRTNELLYSNDFSNAAWVKILSSVTGGQAGYDGTNNAWKWSATSSGVTQLSQATSGSGIRTISIYAKAGSLNVLSFWVGSGIDFDLSTGITAGSPNASMESVGGGWYRCTYFADYGILNPYFNAPSAGDFIYIQSAQVEQGLVATDYIETTTAPVSAGLLGDMPRLDYSGGATCPSLLLEPSRVNLVANSEYFPTFFSGLSVTQNATTSPEGVTNATKAVELSGTNGKAITLDSVSYTSGTTYTHSFFAKSSNRYIQMYFSNLLFTTDHANFDLVNGVVGGKSNDVTSSIEDYGNGWYRCTATITAPATASVSNLLLLVDDVNATRGQAYTGDGSSFVEVYGMQVESGSYPTSYIPTYGSASTRGADSMNVTSATDIIGQTEGTMFVEYDQNLIGQSATRRIMALTDGGILNRIVVYVSSSNKIDFYVRNSSGNLFLGTSTNVNTKGVHKIAAAYKNGDYIVYLDGIEIISGSGTAGTIPACNRIDVGSQIGANPLDEPIKQALLFKTRLTNAELAALTQI